jgi:hypothetical protein
VQFASLAHVGKRRNFSAVGAFLAVLTVAILGSGCAIKLAPDYDKAIFDGLTKINEDAMTLFASVSSGAPQSTYPRRQATYDGLIGQLDAVRIQIDARLSPSPPLFVTTMLSQSISAGSPTSNAGASAVPAMPDVPTLGSVNTMIHTITSMRDRDSKRGLTPMLAEGFKARFEPSIEQALVYEKALIR